ncbi:MAG: S8 family serine peptidase, partial [Synergistaceae bacterium]|nr:S8 family serine peptidase [Synergistaceae bacterium]
MLRKFSVALLFAMLLCLLAIPPNLTEAATFTNDAAPGEVLVVLKTPQPAYRVSAQALSNGTYTNYINSIASAAGGRIAATYDSLSEASGGIFALIKSSVVSENVMLERLKNRSDVIGASINRRNMLFADRITPNDSQLGKLWGIEAIHAPEAWAAHTGTDDVYAVVIDSGIDYTHGDLADNFEASMSASFAEGTAEDEYGDDNGHGSHVAGTIGAVGNNGMGVAGVNWKTRLVSLRIFDASGSCWDSSIINALNRLLELINDNPSLRIAAINMSYGDGLNSRTPSSQLTDPKYIAMKAIDDTNRVIMCVAAGNDGAEIGSGSYTYPASYTGLKNVIVVANADNSDNYSRSLTSNYSKNYVDIAAPGTDIWSTAPEESTLTNLYPELTFSENGYKYLCISGTSMATPHVAGAVTLLASAVPQATTEQIKNAILIGANKDYATDYTTYGFLDIKKALDILRPDASYHAIMTRSLPVPVIGLSYSVQLKMLNPNDEVTWSVSSGNLPNGLTLNSSGLISGTPSTAGEYTFTVQASGTDIMETQEFSVRVYKNPSIASDRVSNAKIGQNYYAVLQAYGSQPITWTLSDGALPDGLVLSADGTIRGVPSAVGSYDFTVSISNANGSDSRNYSLSVTDSVSELKLNITYYTEAALTNSESDYSSARMTGTDVTLQPIFSANMQTSPAAFRVSRDVQGSTVGRAEKRNVKAEDISGTLTIGAGSGSYSYKYYDSANGMYTTKTVGSEANTFGLVRDSNSVFGLVTLDGYYVDFLDGTDTAFKDRSFEWVITGNPSLNGRVQPSNLMSVSEQMEKFVPHAKMISPDSDGRFEAAQISMVKLGSTPELVEAPFSGWLEIWLHINFVRAVSDNGDAVYDRWGMGTSEYYYEGSTLSRIVPISLWSGIGYTNVAPRELASIELTTQDNNSDASINYHWTFRNPNAWGQNSDYEITGLYLDVNCNSSVTLSDGKPDYDSYSDSGNLQMNLYGYYGTPEGGPTSKDVRKNSLFALSDADGILTIGAGEGSYTYNFWSGDTYIRDEVSADEYEIALYGGGSYYWLNGSFNDGAASGLKGRKVSWSIKANPALNSETDILSEISPDKDITPYVELVKDGDTYTGISWRFRDSAAVLKSDMEISLTIETMTPFHYEDGYIQNYWNDYKISSETVKAGTSWSGSYTFKEALPQMDLYNVRVEIVNSQGSVQESHGRCSYSWTFYNDERWNNPKPVGLRPHIDAYSNSVLTNDGSIVGTAPSQSSFNLHLTPRYSKPASSDLHEPVQIASDTEPSGTLTIKAGNGTYRYYDSSLGQEVTAGSQDVTFNLYNEWDDEYYLSDIYFRENALAGLIGRTLEWTTDKYGHESTVLSVGDMIPYGHLTSQDAEGLYHAFEWYAAKSGDNMPLVCNADIDAYIEVYDNEGVSIAWVSNTVYSGDVAAGTLKFSNGLALDEVSRIYFSLNHYGRDESAIFYFSWNFSKKVMDINSELFPDDAFRQYILENVDTNQDGSLSQSEINDTQEIDVYGEGVSSLKGIEIFTNLTYLDCSSNNLTELNLTANTALTELYCGENNLTTLNLTGNTALTYLSCYNNKLTELDLTANTALLAVDCSENNLTELDVKANTALTYLYCSENNLTELNLTANTALTYLSCYNNNLTELDVKANTALTKLHCNNNSLTTLDLTANTALKELYCGNNSLTSLNVRGLTQLEYLDAYGNNLKEIDLSTNKALQRYNLDPGTNIIWEVADDTKPEFRTHSLLLSGQIGVNFYMLLPEIYGVDYTNSYMDFDIAGDKSNVSQYFDPEFMNKKKTYYGFRCYINSVQMADKITAT